MSEPTKRWLAMIERYGSEEEAKAEMARRAEKSKRNLGGKGGFGSLDKETLKAVASKGGMRSRRRAINS